jgi:hypothetical protein
MSENLMDSIAPQLAPPVSREPIGGAESEQGSELMECHLASCSWTFADDDAE